MDANVFGSHAGQLDHHQDLVVFVEDIDLQIANCRAGALAAGGLGEIGAGTIDRFGQ